MLPYIYVLCFSINPPEYGENYPVRIEDCNDGTYKLYFRTVKSGRYGIKISVINRPIKDNPLYFDVSDHNNPIAVYGSRGKYYLIYSNVFWLCIFVGSGKDEFMQPVAVAIDEKDQTVYVLDTGNSRIIVLSEKLECIKHVTNEGLLGRSATGE